MLYIVVSIPEAVCEVCMAGAGPAGAGARADDGITFCATILYYHCCHIIRISLLNCMKT